MCMKMPCLQQEVACAECIKPACRTYERLHNTAGPGFSQGLCALIRTQASTAVCYSHMRCVVLISKPQMTQRHLQAICQGPAGWGKSRNKKMPTVQMLG